MIHCWVSYLVNNRGSLEGRIVAVGKSYSAYHLLKDRYPEIQFLQVSNTGEALKRVAKKEAFAAVDILPNLQFQIEQFSSEQVKLSSVTDIQFPLQVMVSKQHAQLIPLINAAIDSITPQERTEIYQRWMRRDVITHVDYSLLWQVLIFAAVLIVIALAWNRRLYREVEQRKKVEFDLTEANEEIIVASRVKDEFLATMSHELRTPLTAIIGNAELLSERSDDNECRELARSIEVAGHGQLALVNDILDMSKIDAGKFTIEEQPYSITRLLKDIEHTFAVTAKDAGLDLNVEQQNREEYLLIGDRQRVVQVLVNLVGNAIKFTEAGAISLTTHVEKQWFVPELCG